MTRKQGVPFGPGSRASHEAASASSPEASIPNALVDAIGSLVSMIADARDTYPDDSATLEVVTETINEIYGCLIDGVFGAIQFPLADEAFSEALRRYPEAHGPLVFLWAATGLGFRKPTPEQLEWAREKASAIEARSDATPKSDAAEGESAAPQEDAQS